MLFLTRTSRWRPTKAPELTVSLCQSTPPTHLVRTGIRVVRRKANRGKINARENMAKSFLVLPAPDPVMCLPRTPKTLLMILWKVSLRPCLLSNLSHQVFALAEEAEEVGEEVVEASQEAKIEAPQSQSYSIAGQLHPLVS